MLVLSKFILIKSPAKISHFSFILFLGMVILYLLFSLSKRVKQIKFLKTVQVKSFLKRIQQEYLPVIGRQPIKMRGIENSFIISFLSKIVELLFFLKNKRTFFSE